MQFDIFKRATKLERYEIFLESQKPKMPKAELDKVFERIHYDTQQRILNKSRLDTSSNKILDTSANNNENRKMSSAESESLYNNWMERYKKSQEILDLKRQQQKMKQEEEEQKILEMQKGRLKNRRKSANCTLVDRMEHDVERRKYKMEQKKKEQAERTESEIQNFFVPKTNKNLPTNIQKAIQNRPKSRLNVSVCSQPKEKPIPRPQIAQQKPAISKKVVRPRPVMRDSKISEAEKSTERLENSAFATGILHGNNK